MLYKRIFEEVKYGDTISLTKDNGCDDFALDVPEYISFVNDKIATRKEIEKIYKCSNFIGQSFRVFLLEVVYELRSGKKYTKKKYFSALQETIIEDVKERIQTCYARHPNIEKDLTRAFWEKDAVLKSFGFDKYFIKFEFGSLYQLKNGMDYLAIFLKLDADSKKIFVEKVGDDRGKNIMFFEDPNIYQNGVSIFSCVTHEDWYFWPKDRKKH